MINVVDQHSITSYTKLRLSSTIYKWTIEHFLEYLEECTILQTGSRLRSSTFYSEDRKYTFSLSLILIDNITHKPFKHLTYCLDYSKCEKPLKMKINISIIDNGNRKYKECKQVIVPEENGGTVSFVSLCEKSILSQHAKELLPNNHLTLECEVTIYETFMVTIEDEPISSSLKNQLKQLEMIKNSPDFTFIVDNEKFQAHKILLKAYSPVFTAMLESEMIEKETNQTTVTDIRPNIFKIMLYYIYTNKINVDLDKNDAIELLAAANKYQLTSLQFMCAEFLSEKIVIDNAIEILSVANLYGSKRLVNDVKRYIQMNGEEFFNAVDIDELINNVHLLNI